ncbi:protein Lines homolog 1 isoform X1 [Nannospalax galili]|uniref:protein Lines homolog 1 isoform X1 n=1 Tax=Nannospalax galili TaxID=1026970 RepID=UPI0004ED0747|nr:protein Lines homolog 1 isoform X1 [Nannospalax galili]XP_008847756.1 protein Lines homolog 1 isoform X1 [Nannospalax galili]XP_029410167.1 protein Lines homolog 1 isoform X1 [Nannospalax galili]
MEAFFKVLDQLYKKVLLGATLENDIHGYMFYLNPELSEQACCTASLAWSNSNGKVGGVPGQPRLSSSEVITIPEPGECAERHSQMSRAREVKLLQLTVMNVMLTRVLSSETETRAKEEYREITGVLLQSAEIDSKLICMLQNPDKLLSHMAAKCLASLLYFQLREKITLSNSWIAFGQKHLSEYSESDAVVHFLWISTVVIKEILKDTCSQKTEVLQQLLTPFDAAFEVFHAALFSQHFENCRDPAKKINCLMCFLELLELLTASRIHLKLHCRSQRMLFLKPCVLEVLTWPIQAFVKRKLIILIKRCLLYKVGEDLCRGSVPALISADHLLEADMLALADAVLHAVQLGLLKALSVHGRPSGFGGEIQARCEHSSGADHVMLRAASLITMKSLEIKLQNCNSANEMKVDLQKFMSELLTFLKPHLQPSLHFHNPCEWLSRVFIEQDDDMLEAAKASLSIYLKLAREWEAAESLTQEKEAWISHTHGTGCNPHCIFLFFLKNIAFDSTVLLDFLISSETCFLEYFVRYLKLLQRDWVHFLTICKFFDANESQCDINICGLVPSLSQDRHADQTALHALTPPGGPRDALVRFPWASEDPSEPHDQVSMPKETHPVRAHSLPSPWIPKSLVDYDSSEDSDVEATDQCSANMEQTSFYQETIRKIQDPAGTSRDLEELSLEPQSRPPIPEESNPPFSAEVDLDNPVSEVAMLYRTVKCLGDLHDAIYRLQKKNLFPYNPTALLKLLRGVEAISDKV